MNHGWLRPSLLSSAVPVLPATSTPSSAAAVPVPSRTTFFIITVRSRAVWREITRSASSGSISVDRAPVRVDDLASAKCGLSRTPPLPIVCATDGHLQRRREQVALADRDAADVDPVARHRHQLAVLARRREAVICSSG